MLFGSQMQCHNLQACISVLERSLLCAPSRGVLVTLSLSGLSNHHPLEKASQFATLNWLSVGVQRELAVGMLSPHLLSLNHLLIKKSFGLAAYVRALPQKLLLRAVYSKATCLQTFVIAIAIAFKR